MKPALLATLTRLLLTSIALLTAAESAGAQALGPATGFEAITYRPRSYRPRNDQPRYREARSSNYRSSAQTQLHVGFFSPSEFSSTGLVLGFRGGAAIDEHLQIGAALDWNYKNERQTSVVSEQSLPTGGSAQVTRVLSRASSNLVPLLGYIQVSGDRSMTVIPYGGAGIGYEAYFLSADDFNTGAHFDAAYGGFGWQAWAGAQVPLGGLSRLVGEAFVNMADLGRDVDINGQTYRETVNLNGAGMRFGVSWGF
jgi:hypothetical protein